MPCTSRMPIVSSTSTTTCIAPAKVNLCLRVTGRRDDGYHLLDSVFVAIDFSDEITITIRPPQTRGASQISVSCDCPDVPNDATNLAARAARTLLAETGLDADVAITIVKRIPPGAGLGGGSSNAASVLRAVDTVLGLDIAERRLAELALTLGADVPFFLTGGCARVRGIGEQVEAIPGWPGRSLVLALPPVAVSTAWAFRAYAAQPKPRPGDRRSVFPAARLAAACEVLPELLENDLESVVLPAHPAVACAKRGLLDAGAAAAVMSGSGAAVVGLVPPGAAARALAASFAARHPEIPVHCVRILGGAAAGSVDPTPGYP